MDAGSSTQGTTSPVTAVVVVGPPTVVFPTAAGVVVGRGDDELVQAANISARTAIPITPSLRTVPIVFAYTLGTFNGCQVRPPLVVRHIKTGRWSNA